MYDLFVLQGAFNQTQNLTVVIAALNYSKHFLGVMIYCSLFTQRMSSRHSRTLFFPHYLFDRMFRSSKHGLVLIGRVKVAHFLNNLLFSKGCNHPNNYHFLTLCEGRLFSGDLFSSISSAECLLFFPAQVDPDKQGQSSPILK